MNIFLCTFLVLSCYISVIFAISENEEYSENYVDSFNDVDGFNTSLKTHQYASLGSKVCMKELGCFEITRDFQNNLKRPMNLLPQDRATIKTKFILFTKEHPKEDHELDVSDPEEIRDSPLDPTHKTAFVVHGFFDSRYYGKWMEVLKEDLLLYTNYNIIIVDWSKGNGAPYTQASANTRVVGAEIALMIEALKKHKGVKSMDCHIIGHSLGAHVAGYAGERLNKLGRITGLDPAAPYFQDMPPSVRLDPTDADFVDVIHTDSASLKLLALGMSQAVGHVDFYPNNGMSQPGCKTASLHSIFLDGLVEAGRRFMACNHQRSVDFFSYSINYKKALPVAYRCVNFQNYLDGNCGECGPNNTNCAVMGMKADQFKPNKNDKKSVKMYITTMDKQPFWEFTYLIKIKLRKPKSNPKDETGEIYLKVKGAKKTNDVTLSTKKGALVHGSLYSFLVRRKESFGEIKGLTFGWKGSFKVLKVFKSRELSVDYVKIIPMNTGDDKIQKQQTKTFCDKAGKPIASEKSSSLTLC